MVSCERSNQCTWFLVKYHSFCYFRTHKHILENSIFFRKFRFFFYLLQLPSRFAHGRKKLETISGWFSESPNDYLSRLWSQNWAISTPSWGKIDFKKCSFRVKYFPFWWRHSDVITTSKTFLKYFMAVSKRLPKRPVVKKVHIYYGFLNISYTISVEKASISVYTVYTVYRISHP